MLIVWMYIFCRWPTLKCVSVEIDNVKHLEVKIGAHLKDVFPKQTELRRKWDKSECEAQTHSLFAAYTASSHYLSEAKQSKVQKYSHLHDLWKQRWHLKVRQKTLSSSQRGARANNSLQMTSRHFLWEQTHCLKDLWLKVHIHSRLLDTASLLWHN